MEPRDGATLVDLSRYPIDRPGSRAYGDLIESSRATLQDDGILLLDGFLSANGLKILQEEAKNIEATAYLQESLHTVYFSDPDDSKPPSHPLRRTVWTRKRSVARHLMAEDSAMNALYEWPPVKSLIGGILGIEPLYLHADPSNALVLNAYGPGENLGWHFDRAHFTVTLLLRDADGGGAFEYVPGIRTDGNENFERVQEVLEGDDSDVQTADMHEGMMVIFKGHDSLHRVRPVTGPASRHLLILHFEEKPGVRISQEFRQLIFGPDAPAD